MEALCNSLLQCLGNKYGLNHILAQQGTNIMPVPRCARGVCNSDDRYRHKDYTKNVSFFTFPKPNLSDSADHKKVQCHQWIKACGQFIYVYIQNTVPKRCHKLGSTLAHAMACCLMAPSHYLNSSAIEVMPLSNGNGFCIIMTTGLLWWQGINLSLVDSPHNWPVTWALVFSLMWGETNS